MWFCSKIVDFGPWKAHFSKKSSFNITHFLFICKCSEWPGNSPDLSPIENVWIQLKQECFPVGVYDMSHITIKALVTKWFAAYTVEKCRHLLSGCTKRMDLLHEADYWSIPYWGEWFWVCLACFCIAYTKSHHSFPTTLYNMKTCF